MAEKKKKLNPDQIESVAKDIVTICLAEECELEGAYNIYKDSFEASVKNLDVDSSKKEIFDSVLINLGNTYTNELVKDLNAKTKIDFLEYEIRAKKLIKKIKKTKK